MLPFPKLTVWIGSATLVFALVASASATSAMTPTSPSSSSSSSSGNIDTPPSLTSTERHNAKIWNRFAKGYAQSPIQDEASYQTKLTMTRQYLSPTTTRALEFGCGTGGTALLHAPYVQHLDAIDVSSTMIDIAKAKQKEHPDKCTNVHFDVQGIDSFQAPDASYDVILGLSILHLLPNRVQAIQKVHRLLKPGGVFVSSTICIGELSMAVRTILKYMGPALSSCGIIPHIQVFSKNTLRKDLENNGFSIEQEFHPGPDKAVFWIAKKVK